MAKRKAGIIGYGVIGQQIRQFILEQEEVSETEFFYFDDFLSKEENKNKYPFAGFKNDQFKDLDFYIGLGYHHLKISTEVYQQLKKINFRNPAFIHKASYVDPSAEIRDGVIIYPMANIGISVKLAEGVLINNSAVISHDSVIGRHTFISPGVIISGRVSVGYNCFIGSGAVVANDVQIGNNVRIGIGTSVTANIADDLCVIGNPMRIVRDLRIK